MTWNTPIGNRKLTGIERDVFYAAICRMTRELIEEPIDGPLSMGICVFDSMSACQQLVMLDYVRHYLFDETMETNQSTAVVEGTTGAILAYISGSIVCELESEVDWGEYSNSKPPRFWRKLILNAIRTFKWELDPRNEPDDWKSALELLHDRILHDDDYNLSFTDAPPETSTTVNNALGIDGDYFTSIPLPEPDGPEMVELIRRLLN